MPRRLRDYCRIAAWQAGIGYLALWAMAYWTLDQGPQVFARSGLCHADAATVLFYWTCDPASPLQILANLANGALTTTVWAPVYVMAAIVDPVFLVVAAPIVLAHAIGAPLALLVVIRSMSRLFDAARRFRCGSAGAAAREAHRGAEITPPSRAVERKPPLAPRHEFGLRLKA
jgi:hypothetical protein